MKRVALAVACLVMAGCDTRPVTVPTPSSDIQAPELLVAADGLVPVKIKRDEGITGSGCAKQVYIQGREVARLRAGQGVTIYLKPGVYILSSKPVGICGGGLAEVEARVAASDPPIYRLSTSAMGGDTISRTAF